MGTRFSGPLFLNYENQMSSKELEELKERAKMMGLNFSPNIGVDALRAKVEAALNGTDEDKSADPVVAAKQAERDSIASLRRKQQQEELALVRIRLACLNPNKAAVPGEFITVGNTVIGSVTKFIPFGEETQNGYHVPKIIYNELKNRKFNQVRVIKDGNGRPQLQQKLVPEFAVEVLEPLTREELDKLAAQQAAAAGLD